MIFDTRSRTMPHDELEKEALRDHALGQPEGSTFTPPGSLAGAAPSPTVPMAEALVGPLGIEEGPIVELTPTPEGPIPPIPPIPFPEPGRPPGLPFPYP